VSSSENQHSEENFLIAYLEGRLVDKSPTQLVLDINGVGYEVKIPLSTFDKLGENGSKAKILTYQYVREDTLQLFGFATIEEKNLFELLITISGIGPKTALGILSSISVNDFQRSIVSEDLDSLTSISGIGKKSAQRLIVELKEKIGGEEFRFKKDMGLKDRSELILVEEALKALVSLGFNKASAKEAVNKAKSESDLKMHPQKKLGLEELIKKALKYAQ
jgi:holliday junction DNA helicase RuvA